jgi:hypothetical protein
MQYGNTLIRQNFYTKVIDAPKLGRGKGAHWLESGWEWDQQFVCQVSSSNANSTAGYLINNTY